MVPEMLEGSTVQEMDGSISKAMELVRVPGFGFLPPNVAQLTDQLFKVWQFYVMKQPQSREKHDNLELRVVSGLQVYVS